MYKSQIWAVRSGSDGPDRIVPIRPRVLILTVKSRSDGSPWVSRGWRRISPEIGNDDGAGSGVDAPVVVVPPRMRGGQLRTQGSKARKKSAVEVCPTSWNDHDGRPELEPKAAARVWTNPALRFAPRLGEVAKGCCTTPRRGWTRSRGLGVGLLAGIGNFATAARADSGEQQWWPGGVIFVRRRGETEAGSWGLYGWKRRSNPAKNAANLSSDRWRIRRRKFRLEVDDDDVSDDVIQ